MYKNITGILENELRMMLTDLVLREDHQFLRERRKRAFVNTLSPLFAADR